MNSRECYKYPGGTIRKNSKEKQPTLCNLQFEKYKKGVEFEIRRPAFYTGVTAPDIKEEPFHLEQRTGTGDYNIERNNFIQPSVKGRQVIDFERLQAQDIEQAGIKVQLGDKTIQQLFRVQVNDPTDTKWINEKNRRLAAGETEEQIKNNPPFGRQQRKKFQMRNFGESNLRFEDKLEAILQAVKQGTMDNSNDRVQILTALTKLLSEVGDLRTLTEIELKHIKGILPMFNIPRNYKVAGFDNRLISGPQYSANRGLVNLFILSNAPRDRLDQPLTRIDISGEEEKSIPISIRTATTWLKQDEAAFRNAYYIDLQTLSVIPQDIAVKLVNDGIDNGKLNGQNPPEGGWDPDNPMAWNTGEPGDQGTDTPPPPITIPPPV